MAMVPPVYSVLGASRAQDEKTTEPAEPCLRPSPSLVDKQCHAHIILPKPPPVFSSLSETRSLATEMCGVVDQDGPN